MNKKKLWCQHDSQKKAANEAKGNHVAVELWQLTFDICTPRLRWTPEHSMQTRTPRFKDAQSGSGAPQSAHLSFPHTLRNTSIGFSDFMQDRICCKPFDGRSWCAVAELLSDVYSSTAVWSKSVLSYELLSLAERWWLLPIGLIGRHWNIMDTVIKMTTNQRLNSHAYICTNYPLRSLRTQ